MYNRTGLPTSVIVSNGTQYLISGLEAYTFYQFSIFASTVVGGGPATMPLVLRTDIAGEYTTLTVLATIDNHYYMQETY